MVMPLLAHPRPFEAAQDGQHAGSEHDRQRRVHRPAPGPLPGPLPNRYRPGLNRPAVEESLQVGRQFPCARVTPSRPLFETFQHDRLEVSRQAGRRREATAGPGPRPGEASPDRSHRGAEAVRSTARKGSRPGHKHPSQDRAREAGRQPVPAPCRRASRSARRCASPQRPGRAAWPGRSRRSAG